MMPFFLKAIDGYMLNNYGSSPFNDPEAIPIGLSVFHTSFNVINTLLLVNFIGFIGKIVVKILPSKGDNEVFTLEHIGTGLMDTGELSITEATKEVSKFGEITSRMFIFLREFIQADNAKNKQRLLNKIKKYEEITDHIESEVNSYLINVSEQELSAESIQKISQLNSITHELERIADIIFQLSRDLNDMQDENRQFNQEQRSSILNMMQAIEGALKVMNENLKSDYSDVSVSSALEKELIINNLRNAMRYNHLRSMDKTNYNVRVGSIYKDFYYSFELIGDHIINVTEAITGNKLHETIEENSKL
jgi:phosphate:Na+ symporter